MFAGTRERVNGAGRWARESDDARVLLTAADNVVSASHGSMRVTAPDRPFLAAGLVPYS